LTENFWHVKNLPLILAGPILRRTEPDSVTVWLALKELSSVTLQIYATQTGEGKIIDRLLLEGMRFTVELGKHLHLVAVTAKPIGKEILQPGQIYAYDLLFGNNQKSLITQLNPKDNKVSFSYFSHNLPTFSLPPEDLNYLQIVHGSCRKPQGGEEDALACLDYVLEKSAYLPNYRPHQLFLTGDQIYSDDVADPFLETIHSLEKVLFGWEENLPVSYGFQKTSELKPGKRTLIAEQEGGLTAMLHNKPEKAKSHLFSFSEYATAYLITWSSVLLSDRFGEGKKRFKNPKLAKRWDREASAIGNFDRTLSQIRRVLANIPTYMICDDHDVTDDWYLNREWCDRVLSKPLGRRVVQNGLLAYALFQAWGNTPEQFAKGQPGEKLLQAAAKWLASSATDSVAQEELQKYLGIPPINRESGLPQLKLDENVLILQRDRLALQWHYTLRSYNHEVIVIDSRTWRGYPLDNDEKTTPPMLLSPTAFREQLEEPLERTNELNQSGKAKIEATLIVLPTNLVTLSGIDAIQRLALDRDRVFNRDVGDSWNFNLDGFSKLLACLGQKRDRTIILTGDIHYSCAVRLNYWRDSFSQSSLIVQLTSSALKNSEWITRLIHTKIKSLLPESPESWAGWDDPQQLVKIPDTFSLKSKIIPWQRQEIQAWGSALKNRQSLPDWQYRLEWIPRQKAQSIVKTRIQTHSLSFWQKVLNNFIFKFWRNRWLQEGTEVVGRNNISIVSFQWSQSDGQKAVIQDTYWYCSWNLSIIVKSRYSVLLKRDFFPRLPH
jgi:hypothetical protein